MLLATLRALWQRQAHTLLSFQSGPGLRQTLTNLAEQLLEETRRPENSDIIRVVLAESARHQEIGRAFVHELGPVFGTKLTRVLEPFLQQRYSKRATLALVHQFVGSLAHYSLMSQIFKTGRWYLPGQKAYVELLVDNFMKATSVPPLSPRP